MKLVVKALGVLAILAGTPSEAQTPRCAIGEVIGQTSIYARFPGALGGPVEYGASSSLVNRLNPAFSRANQTLNGTSHTIAVFISPGMTEYSLGPTMAFIVDGKSLAEARTGLTGGNIRVFVPAAVMASGRPYSAVFKFNGKEQTLQFDALPDPVGWARKALVDKQRAGSLPAECRRYVGRI